jgi:predicted alpha/beta hydrolase family esterase
MSSKVYFSDKTSKVSRFFVRIAIDIYRALFPKSALKKIRKILVTPHKPQVEPMPDYIQSETVNTRYGDLKTYVTGQGPKVLFIHGWSGSASQFFPLMKLVASYGYQTISFDHYKHGRSGGRECNYPLFLKAIENIDNHYVKPQQPHFIVSHSMGCSTTVDYFKSRQIPHFLIAPLFDFYNQLEARVTGVGVSKTFFEKIVTVIEDEYKINIRDRDPFAYIKTIQDTIFIIHSKSDRFAPYEHTLKVTSEQGNIHLETHEDIGHMRLVSAPETLKLLKQFCQKLYKSNKTSKANESALH